MPRRNWKYSMNCVAMEKTRKRINSLASRILLDLGGAYIKHPDITLESPSLYHEDGVHLSSLGNVIFLRGLQAGLTSFHSGRS